MTEFVHPWQQLANIFFRAYGRAVFECGCEGSMAIYASEWFSPPTQPYATVAMLGNPKGWKLAPSNPFGSTLPPEDLARLAADPTRRARWEELVVHTVLPPLRELLPVIQTKVIINQSAGVWTHHSCVDSSCLVCVCSSTWRSSTSLAS